MDELNSELLPLLKLLMTERITMSVKIVVEWVKVRMQVWLKWVVTWRRIDESNVIKYGRCRGHNILWEKLSVLDWENEDVKSWYIESKVDSELSNLWNWRDYKNDRRTRDCWVIMEQRCVLQDIEYCVTIVWEWIECGILNIVEQNESVNKECIKIKRMSKLLSDWNVYQSKK